MKRKEPILTGVTCDIVFDRELYPDDFVCLKDINLRFENKKQNSKIGFTNFYGKPDQNDRNILKAHYYGADLNSFPRMKSIDDPNVQIINSVGITAVPGKVNKEIRPLQIRNVKLEFGDVSFVINKGVDLK